MLVSSAHPKTYNYRDVLLDMRHTYFSRHSRYHLFILIPRTASLCTYRQSTSDINWWCEVTIEGHKQRRWSSNSTSLTDLTEYDQPTHAYHSRATNIIMAIKLITFFVILVISIILVTSTATQYGKAALTCIADYKTCVQGKTSACRTCIKSCGNVGVSTTQSKNEICTLLQIYCRY